MVWSYLWPTGIPSQKSFLVLLVQLAQTTECKVVCLTVHLGVDWHFILITASSHMIVAAVQCWWLADDGCPIPPL